MPQFDRSVCGTAACYAIHMMLTPSCSTRVPFEELRKTGSLPKPRPSVAIRLVAEGLSSHLRNANWVKEPLFLSNDFFVVTSGDLNV